MFYDSPHMFASCWKSTALTLDPLDPAGGSSSLRSPQRIERTDFMESSRFDWASN